MAERIAMRVDKGALVPASASDLEKLRARKYRMGDIVFADLRKPRSPGFHRLVHQFGVMLVENVEAFETMQAHQVLKRLQIEGDIACDYMAIVMPGVGPVHYRMPKSLAYESMDEGEFQQVYKAFASHVAKQYMQTLTPEQVEELVEIMPDEAI